MTAAAIDMLGEVKKPKKKVLGKEVGIPVRRLGKTYGDDLPTLWFADNPFLTAFFSGFSAQLPEGEDQFLYSVRLFQKKITEPTLKKQVRAFIGQEAHHSNEHVEFNNLMIERGLKLDEIEKALIKQNKWMRKNQTPAQQLAMTVCMEHLTAVLADWALSSPNRPLDMMADPARTMWGWHAVEELEHKGVAFDVYEQLVGDRKLLHRTMRFTMFMFITTSFINAFKLMRGTGGWTNWKKHREAAKVLFSWYRFSRSDYNDFYKKDYHPWDHDCRETLKRGREEFLGEKDATNDVYGC